MSEPPETTDVDALLGEAGWVRSLAGRLVADEHRAEDVAQEAMIAALAHPPRRGVPLRAWLGRVTRNFARRAFRTESRRTGREAAVARPCRAPDGPSLVRAERFRELVGAVVGLPEIYREAVLLHHFDGLSPANVAKRLGLPVETVRTRLKRARAELRKRLDEAHGGDRSAWLVPLLLGGSRSLRGPTGAAAAAGGILVAKKLVAVALVLALTLLGAGWVLTRDASAPAPPGGPPDSDPAASASPLAAEAGGETRSDGAPEPEVPGNAVRGTVRGPDGEPVPRAVLYAVPADLPGRGAWDGEATAVAGEEGRFALDLPSTAPYFDVVASAPGYAPAVWGRVRPGASGDLVLGRTVVLSGTVRDLDGDPVPGARVRWVFRMGDAALVCEATTGAKGVWRMTDVLPAERIHGVGEPRQSFFAVDAEGYAPLTVTWGHAGWEPGEERQDLWLGRGATVTGNVTDAESARPLEDARVFLLLSDRPAMEPVVPGAGLYRASNGPRRAGQAGVDAAGRFRFEHAPALSFRGVGSLVGLGVGAVAAVAPGHSLGEETLPLSREGEELDIPISLWPAAAVTGRVVDEDGEPVVGVRVWSVAKGRDGGQSVPVPGARSAHDQTGVDGRYRLSGVPVPGSASVSIDVSALSTRPGIGSAKGRIRLDVRSGKETRAPDLVLRSTGGTTERPSILVEVVGPDCAPVWGASLGRGPLRNEVRTGSDGIARFPMFATNGGFLPGLVVRAPGFAPTVTPPLVAADGEPVRVELRPGGRLAGRVVFPDGAPAGGGTVYAIPAEVPVERVFVAQGVPRFAGELPPGDLPRLLYFGVASVDDLGRFSLDDLPAEAATVVLVRPYADGRRRFSAEHLAPGTEDLVIEVPRRDPPRGTLECRVRDGATNRTVPRYSVEIEDLDAPGKRVPRRDERPAPGVWRSEIPPGLYRIRVIAPGYPPAEAEATVVERGPVAVVEVSLAAGSAVRGTVRLPEEPDCRGAMISFVHEREGKRELRWGRIGEDGGYRIDGLSPGRYWVELYLAHQLAGGPAIAPREALEVEVPEGGGDLSLDVEAVRAASLLIRTEVPEGIALGSPASVRVTDLRGRTVSRFPTYDSASQLWLQAPPGPLRVSLLLPGRPALVEEVRVGGGERRMVTFNLSR